MHRINFYGSQVGGKTVTPHSYTDSPLALLRHDIVCAIKLLKFLPFIVWPLMPWGSGSLCELSLTYANVFGMSLHLILFLIQTPFILSMPIWFLFPLWSVAAAVATFWVVNQVICYALNGSKMLFTSNPKYAKPRKEHEYEQWIFLNGVAVGQHWLQANIDRIALTFGRPVIGVHNKTNGIIFDVIQCLIQRNFDYATNDIRDAYKIVKETLYNPKLRKVVFILHSQGSIEGGMVIDWLLQEVPQDLMGKLEVYTFGNACNHFNNPHLYLLSERAALCNPTTASTTKTTAQVHYHDPVIFDVAEKSEDGCVDRRTKSHQSSTAGKSIRYIEHYAHTYDYVSQFGILHAIGHSSSSPTAPRFMGRVFVRQGEGHQFNQHYLDNMFPLKKSAIGMEGIGGSGYDGAADESEFMSSVVEFSQSGDERKDEREGVEMSYFGAHGESLEESDEVLLRDPTPPITRTSTTFALKPLENGTNENGLGTTNGAAAEPTKSIEFQVKDLSRLWLYRNGKSPKIDEVDVGIARMSTI